MVCIRETTLEDTDDVIEKMYKFVDSDEELKTELKNARDCRARWATLENFIIENSEDMEVDFVEYHMLWIRERFFYEMQKRTNLDYGFCPYFVPAFRTRTKAILTENYGLDGMNKCTYKTEPVDTTCSGTQRDTCAILREGR